MVKAVCVIAGDVKGNIYFEQVDENGNHLIFFFAFDFLHPETAIAATRSHCRARTK